MPTALRAESPPLILVVDDTAAKRYVTARWLQRAGFRTHEVATGEETLLAAAERPDLVILDVRLPDMSGFEVCRRLKRDPLTASVPVLHLSAHVTTSDDRVAGLDGGADAYLVHPVDPEELIATVQALLRIRRTEAALRESEERYRLVARATNDVIWDWDLTSGHVLWNDAARTLFRRRSGDIETSIEWWHRLIHPDDRPRVLRGMYAVIDGAGELWMDEYRLRRGDGSYATVFDRGFVAHDETGRPVRMIGSMLDVTSRKRAEREQQLLAGASSALAETLDPESTLRRFMRFVTGGFADLCLVLLLDEQGEVHAHEVTSTDPARARALAAPGWPETDAGRTVAAHARRVLHEGRGEVCDLPARGRPDADGYGSIGVLFALGLRSGLLVPLPAHGSMRGAMLFGRVEPTQHYDPDDLAFATQLVGRVAMALDNARLYESAVVANRAKGDFLAVMSHELRTPLNAVVGYTDLLMMEIPGPLTDDSRYYVGRVQVAARHLLTLIEQILSFSRMEAGRETVVLEPVSLRALLEDTGTLVEPLAEERGLGFDLQLSLADDEDVVLETDVGKVRQILLNLLSNAVKFTDRGAVALDVRREGEELTLRVRDTGIGIAPDHLERIFDSFWQVEQRKTRKVGGSGLGLTVSRRLALLLGGDLAVESELGEGSTFILRLPLVPPSEVRRLATERGASDQAPRARASLASPQAEGAG